MIYVLPNILPDTLVEKIRQLAADAEFVDGMRTAGIGVAHSKRNEEISTDSDVVQEINQEVKAGLARNNDFQIVTIPRQLSNFLVSRYTPGMTYGDHTDNAILGGRMRSDMSMTIFLNDPKEYDGGELVMNTDIRPERYKLPPGHAVIYPTYFLHRVAPVTRGTRLAVVGWIQSMVRDPFQRQILIDLALSLNYFLQNTKEKFAHPEYIRLDKVYNNLKRQWVEM
ncbi:MAG: Fe2+-dependent dioxygenase [Rhodospirillaceae bacterium]|nr:Fe2+-dependent dioxygenase [Rhodospirillaceae bacterium]